MNSFKLSVTIAAILSALHCEHSIGQEARLCVQTGHSAGINEVDYNYNSELAASCGADNKVVVWHVASGKQFSNFTDHTADVTSVVFHPSENTLYSASSDSTVRVWDIENNLLDTTLKFNFPIGDIAISMDGRFLAIAGNELILVDNQTYARKPFAISPKDKFTCVEFSHQRDWLVVGGKKESKAYVLYLPETEVRQVHLIGLTDAKFSENDQSVFLATQNGQIIESDLITKETKSTATKSEFNAFNSIVVTAEKIVGVTELGTIEIFDRATWIRQKSLEGHLQNITCIALSHNQKHILTGSDDHRLIRWDLEKNEMVRTLKSNSYRINHIDFDDSGDNLIIGYSNGLVRKTNILSNNSISNRMSLNQIMIETGWEYHLQKIEDIKDSLIEFKILLTRKSPFADQGFETIRELAIFWNTTLNEIEFSQLNYKSARVSQYEVLAAKGIWNDETYFLNDSLRVDSDEMLTAIVEGSLLIVKSTLTGKEKFRQQVNHSDRITSIAINEKYDFVAVSSWDGMISFWSLEDGSHLVTLGAFNASDFIYLNNSNQYFSSKGALNNIGFIIKDQMFSFDQFDLKYNRPDLVFSKLPYVDEKTIDNYFLAYKKRLSKLGITEDQLKISTEIPKLELELSNTSISYDGWLKYTVKAEERKKHLSSFHILVNGVPEFSRTGMKLHGFYFEHSDSIELNPGVNLIQFYITDHQGVSSLKQTFEINNLAKPKKQDLYLITIGCSKYKQDQFNLNYAEKDALDLTKYFRRSRHFDKVFTETLVNENVTKEKAQNLNSFLAKVRVDDVVLLFIAGHGVLDANLDYYIATHDMDFQKPQERGISISYFEDLLDKIKSRKKLMLIDACHSGEIDKSEVTVDTSTTVTESDDIAFRAVGTSVKNVNEVNSFELSRMVFADVRESNGSTVISSAGGAEFAFEGDQWNNGVFTYVFLSGLKSGKADLNRDGKIMISELHRYLIFEVNKLTNGQQTPTSRVENLINDFQID